MCRSSFPCSHCSLSSCCRRFPNLHFHRNTAWDSDWFEFLSLRCRFGPFWLDLVDRSLSLADYRRTVAGFRCSWVGCSSEVFPMNFCCQNSRDEVKSRQAWRCLVLRMSNVTPAAGQASDHLWSQILWLHPSKFPWSLQALYIVLKLAASPCRMDAWLAR